MRTGTCMHCCMEDSELNYIGVSNKGKSDNIYVCLDCIRNEKESIIKNMKIKNVSEKKTKINMI